MGQGVIKVGGSEVFVDRGDAAGSDWTQATLTVDSGWHDLDLTGIMPAGAKAVLLRVHIDDNLTDQLVYFRTNGNVNSWNRSRQMTQVANQYIQMDMIVVPDAAGIIEYTVTTAIIDVTIVVAGWWI